MPGRVGGEFEKLAREVSRAEFARRWDHPFLAIGDFQAESEWSFETRVADFDLGSPVHLPDTMQPGARIGSDGEVDESGDVKGIYPVLKSDRNPYKDRVSVGRARTCDVVFPTRYVSKLHAHFLRTDDGAWELRDAGSTNGTYRNGVRVPPNQKVRLGIGDHVRFGFIDTQFVDGGLLHDLLRGNAR